MKNWLHGLVLYLANLAGVITGFILYKLSGGSQLCIQIPTAAVVSVCLFIFYWYLLKRTWAKALSSNPINLIWIFIAALAWNPVIFISLHYATQGYLTAIENILAMMCLQMPINAAALAIIYNFFTAPALD